jgi:hypothetical protein
MMIVLRGKDLPYCLNKDYSEFPKGFITMTFSYPSVKYS